MISSNFNLTAHDDEINKLIEENKDLKSKYEEFCVTLKALKLSNEDVISQLNSIDERFQLLESNFPHLSKNDEIIFLQNNNNVLQIKINYNYEFFRKTHI